MLPACLTAIASSLPYMIRAWVGRCEAITGMLGCFLHLVYTRKLQADVVMQRDTPTRSVFTCPKEATLVSPFFLLRSLTQIESLLLTTTWTFCVRLFLDYHHVVNGMYAPCDRM